MIAEPTCAAATGDPPCARPSRLLALGVGLLLVALAVLLLMPRFEPAGEPLLSARGGEELAALGWQRLGDGTVGTAPDALLLRRPDTAGKTALYRFVDRPADAVAFAVRVRLSAEVEAARPGEWNGVRVFLAAPRHDTGLPYRFRDPDLLQAFAPVPASDIAATVVAAPRHRRIALVAGLFATAGELRLEAVELLPLRETVAFRTARAGLAVVAASWTGLWLFGAIRAAGRGLARRGVIVTGLALVAGAAGFAAMRFAPEQAVFAEALAHLAAFAALGALAGPHPGARVAARLALLLVAAAGFELAQGFVDTLGPDDLADLALDLAGAGLGWWIARKLRPGRRPDHPVASPGSSSDTTRKPDGSPASAS